ncbi:MAG: sulfatase-like hydrolase/transferase [Rikenellaceae bacterium]
MNKTLLCSAAAFLPMALSAAAKDAKPNILIIFTDDQGYADYGFMGSKTNKTPVVDKLAESGTVFTDFYAQHVSGPSRSALLTGRYPLRTGGHRLLTEEVTIAEIAKSADYQTACFGKWEVSHRKEVIDQMPNAQGFDYYYGTLGANDKGQVVMHENNTKGGTKI